MSGELHSATGSDLPAPDQEKMIISVAYAHHSEGQRSFKLDVDIQLPGTGVTALFGSSGSGKTTLLRCIAGLTRPDTAHLQIGQSVWQDDNHFELPHRRALGYVFQDANLFAHLNAADNIRYGMRRRNNNVAESDYAHMLEMLDLQSLVNKFPHQLSGGERQRVAIARALLSQPHLIIMDEPLASLDGRRKDEIMIYLNRIKTESQVPILYVTHAVDEVTRLADHVVLLDAGSVVKQGSPSEVFSVADLPLPDDQEQGVIIEGQIHAKDEQWQLNAVALIKEVALKKEVAPEHQVWVRDSGEQIGTRVHLQILARDVSIALSNQTDTSITNRLAAEVVEVAPDADPAFASVRLQVGQHHLIARLTRRSVAQLALQPGMPVWAQIKSVALVR